MRYGFAKAYAKLNLSLDVLSCRDDGYHNLDMIMQSVSLCDSVSVRIGCGGGISTISNVRHIPNDERNIAYKAAKLFEERVGISCGGIYIAMQKRIPSSAGMAGGSADGAAVLRLLNELSGAGISDEKLCEIGLEVGSDVPFCLMGGTARACSKGEELEFLTPLGDCFFVIGKPRRGMSTKAVFAEIDNHPILHHPDTEAMVSAIKTGDVSAVSREVYNVFEPVVSEEVPEISDIESILDASGALCSAMTGSGSSVFGIFDSISSANVAKQRLSEKYQDVFLATPVDSQQVRKVNISG